jgi:hypothetical protein
LWTGDLGTLTVVNSVRGLIPIVLHSSVCTWTVEIPILILYSNSKFRLRRTTNVLILSSEVRRMGMMKISAVEIETVRFVRQLSEYWLHMQR